jgi:hypothetical protein
MNRRSLVIALAAVVGLVITVSLAGAQVSKSFDLSWHVIGGGGGRVSSVHYVVSSTVGQSAAAPPYSFGSRYAVSGGFWFSEGPTISNLYLPLVLKNFP